MTGEDAYWDRNAASHDRNKRQQALLTEKVGFVLDAVATGEVEGGGGGVH